MSRIHTGNLGHNTIVRIVRSTGEYLTLRWFCCSHFANHWGLYANNRVNQAWPQYQPLLDFIPTARKRAAWYNCSAGTQWPGHIAPFGYGGTLAGLPWSSMSIHSNGVLAALNMIAHWEYTQSIDFLRNVAFPFARDALRFYQCWMTRRPDGSWINTMDQSHECNPHVNPVTEATKRTQCYQNNSVIANGFVRRVASALPGMARALGDGTAVDPQWAEIRDAMDPLPTALMRPSKPLLGRVFTMAGNYTASNCSAAVAGASINSGNCGTRDNGHCTYCGAQKRGAMDVGTWHIFPAEATNLASSAELLTTSVNSLRNDAPWQQGNSFCSVFSQAARVGMPVDEWLPELQAIITTHSMKNGVVYQGGGGVEVAGALQVVPDIMLQSVTPLQRTNETFLALFPAVGLKHTKMSFHRLRGKGAFVVSASFDNVTQQLAGVVTVFSEAGGVVRLRLPAGHGDEVVNVTVLDTATGKQVPTTLVGLMVAFETVRGHGYTLSVPKHGTLTNVQKYAIDSAPPAPQTQPQPPPTTNWMFNAKRGVFTHYLDGLQGRNGSNAQGNVSASWSDTVDAFDAEAYAASAAATGAHYATITMMQGSRSMLGPNKAYDRLTGYKPGQACSKRDLVLDIYAALAKRNMKLFLYWTGDGPHEDHQASAGMGMPLCPNAKGKPDCRSNVPQLFAQRWSEVLEEYAVRYGSRVSGWWIDGCYKCVSVT